MAIFNSYVTNYQRVTSWVETINLWPFGSSPGGLHKLIQKIAKLGNPALGVQLGEWDSRFN